MFTIDHLSISFHDQHILKSITLSCAPGSTHVIMGPNGSGKSTLAYAIMGHPKYHRDSGAINYNNQHIHEMAMHMRARAGIFIGFQNPLEIPGVSVEKFLTETYQTHTATPVALEVIKERIARAFEIVKLPASFMQRAVNVGFSGGEKKRLELAQMLVLKPSLVILDEIDSGLDIDGLHIVNEAIAALRKEIPQAIICLISHNVHLAHYLNFDQLHVMKKGMIVASAGPEFLPRLEQEGYEQFAG
jgi:Fe-S cluster assembly ATP-binding protein